MARWMGALLAGLLAGAVVGVAAAWIVLDGGSGAGDDFLAAAKSSTGGVSLERASTGSVADTSPAPAEADALSADRIASDRVDSVAPPEVVDRVAAAALAAPPPPVRRGARSLRGRVIGRDGQPLAEVVVRATRQSDPDRTPGRSRSGDTAPPLDTLDEVIKTAVRGFYDRTSDVREARTAGDGSYAFGDLREGRFLVQAWREGFDLVTTGDSIVRPDATVDFTAVPVVRLDLSVAMPDGSPATRALIQARRTGEKNFRRNDGWSSEQPRLSFAVGEWELKATLGDPDLGPTWPDYLASDLQPVTLTEGSSPPPLALKLKGAPGIRGEVRALGGVGRRQLLVKLELLPAGAAPDLKALAQNHAATNTWAREGRYTFKDLAPGRYVVAATRSWNERIAAHAIVEVRDSMVAQDLEIPALDPARCVVVKVLDPDGRLVDDASFSLLVTRTDGNNYGSGLEPEKRSDGCFLVPLEGGQGEQVDLLANWPAGGTVKLTAQCERFGQKEVELTPSTRSVEIRFGSPATLIATIQGYSGSGFEGRLSLSLVRSDQGSQRHFYYGFDREQIAADGTRKFGPVEAGRYKLRLSSKGRSGDPWGQSEIASVDVLLAQGENRATIGIPALYSVTVEAKGGGQLQLHSAQDGDDDGDFSTYRMAQLDESGRATFEDLPAGEYQLQHWGGGEDDGTMRIRVPTSGVIRFAPMVENVLYVSIQKSDGTLARAGFQDGDLIVAVGGKEYSTAADLQSAMSSALSQKELKVTVLRRRDRVELTVDGKLLANPFEMGGAFQPSTR